MSQDLRPTLWQTRLSIAAETTWLASDSFCQIARLHD
jgi:hypothetical protein